MRPQPFLALLLVALAGCSEPAEPAATTSAPPVPTGQAADFITPGVWDVRGDTDYMMAWVHNLGSTSAEVGWNLTGAQGGPLPAGWNVTFDRTTSKLERAGAKVSQGQGQYAYPDWARAQLRLTIPSSEPGGLHELELRVGDEVRPITVTVHGNRGRVAGLGSHVWVDTVGTFERGGSEFWRSEPGRPFDTVLGESGAVEGVSFGLMGVTAGETVALHVPPAFAYGYDNQPAQQGGQDYAQFNGQTLVFTMTMTRFT